MISPDYVMEMASYNQWQNGVVYRLCADLTDEQRRADRAMYFRSIHSTLDHVLHVDTLILEYAHTGAAAPERAPRATYDDFDALRAARAAFDDELVARALAYEREWLEEPLNVWSDRLRKQRRLPRGLLFVQMFNHQTHHRSQVTTHLYTLGIDYGPTDVPFNPLRMR